jgi:phage pi2 protein 07
MPDVQVLVDNQFLAKEIDRVVGQRLSDIGVGTYWTMQRLERETGHKRDWIKDHILSDPALFRDPHPIAKIVNGQWLFRANKMAEYLDALFDRL